MGNRGCGVARLQTATGVCCCLDGKRRTDETHAVTGSGLNHVTLHGVNFLYRRGQQHKLTESANVNTSESELKLT